MPAAKGGDSKQALVVTLVCFIVLSLILGILTYIGFAGQDPLDKAKKEADRAASEAKALDDTHEAEVALLRSYMGIPPEAGKVQASYEKVSGQNAKDDSFKNLETVRQVANTYGWDPQKYTPKETVKSLKDKQDEKIKELEGKVAQLEGDLKKQTDAAKNAKASRDDLENKYNKALQDHNAKQKEQDENYAKKLEENRTGFGDSGKAIAELKEQMEKKDTDYAKTLKAKDKEIKDMQTLVNKLEDKRPQANPLTLERPRGKIVLMDKTGQLPYINLGSGDRVKPQLTFSVHAVGSDGRPVKESKGSLEVVHVVNEHLSQARVTAQTNVARNPIATGDVLMNAAWDPDQKQHVAIAGIVDLTGDLRKDRPGDAKRALDDFRRTLEGQNIVVDAWIDFSDNSVKGPGLSRQTDYLILGEMPEEKTALRKEGEDTKASARDAARTEAGKLADEAKRLGVPIVKLRDFLAMTGYRLPRSQNENNLEKLHSTVPSVTSPLSKPERQPTPGEGKEKQP
jgi:hypothetical protein